MALTTRTKQKLIKEFATAGGDTGSTEVQTALLSEEIDRLSEHLKAHPKDFHSRRGLLAKVQRRKKFLDYLAASNPRRHSRLIRKLGLKK